VPINAGLPCSKEIKSHNPEKLKKAKKLPNGPIVSFLTNNIKKAEFC